jgi:hypothetical protein
MKTTLHNSPFSLLGVSTRDRADKIVEQAEEKSLFLDSNVCMKARSELTVARNRLATEIRWLPGVAPNRAISLLDALTKNIESLKDDSTMPPLANANVLAAAFEILDPEMDTSYWQDWIMDFAYKVDLIDAEDVLREINSDRTLSGFSEVKSTEQIEEELDERRRYYTETIKSALDRLAPMKLVEVVTNVVEYSTNSGVNHAPRLVDELVDRYEKEANRYLEAEAENIHKLIEAIRNNSDNGEASIKTQVDKLEQVAKKWDAIAQPIQLNMKAQGLHHVLSHNIALGIRSLAVDLFNKHDMINTVNRLTKTLQELFAELPSVVDMLEGDAEAISDIVRERAASQMRLADFENEITYQAKVGVIFKDDLRISPDGVEWKGRRIALDEITKVRWGAIKKSVNGIPSGVDYTIGVGGNNIQEFVIQTTKEEVYSRFIDCLWKATCVRILELYLMGLKEGKTFSIGGVRFDDNGIHLTKHKFFGNESVYEKWGNVSYVSYNGSLQITSQSDKKTYASISYIDVANVHILETIIRQSFKSWKGRLSGILDS